LAEGQEGKYERSGRAEAQDHSTGHIITREFGSWRGEGASLGLVIACIATGQPPKHLELHEQALVIAGASANFPGPQKWHRRF